MSRDGLQCEADVCKRSRRKNSKAPEYDNTVDLACREIGWVNAKSCRATNRGVFINCPFDLDYKEQLNVLLFTVCDGGLSPRIAFPIRPILESFVLQRSLKLIKECRYAIHDKSRVGIETNTQMPRYNVVLELAIFLCAKMS